MTTVSGTPGQDHDRWPIASPISSTFEVLQRDKLRETTAVLDHVVEVTSNWIYSLSVIVSVKGMSRPHERHSGRKGFPDFDVARICSLRGCGVRRLPVLKHYVIGEITKSIRGFLPISVGVENDEDVDIARKAGASPRTVEPKMYSSASSSLNRDCAR